MNSTQTSFEHHSHSTPPLRVFVLEDDMDLSAVIERVLRSIDPMISLDWATSAEEALAIIQPTSSSYDWPVYDLIVADIFLDGKSTGIDFWRTCQDAFPDTPVVMTSALSLDRFFSTIGRDSVCPPFLQKPFTPSECKQIFQNMLGYGARKHRRLV